MINLSETREEDEDYENVIDQLFKELEQVEPQHFAVRQYRKYKLAAGDAAAVRIMCGDRERHHHLTEGIMGGDMIQADIPK